MFKRLLILFTIVFFAVPAVGVQARDDVDPSRDCDDKCNRIFHEVLNSCTSDAGIVATECQEKANRALQACLLGCNGEPPPPPPPSCMDRCEDHAILAVRECLSRRDDISEEECKEKVAPEFEQCLLRCQDQLPPTCMEYCNNGAERVFRACKERGGSDERCKSVATDFNRRCIHDCEDGPRPPCRERCVHIARQVLVECMSGDDDGVTDVANVDDEDSSTDCEEKAARVLKRCLVRCEHRPVGCRERCARRARDVYSGCLARMEAGVKECVEAGNNEEDCKLKARRECRVITNRFLAGCIRESCPSDEPPPLPCEDRCEARVQDFLAECEAKGADNCAEHATDLKARCLHHCDSDDPMPPCDVDCEEIAVNLKERCANSDLTPEECVKRIMAFVENCKMQLAEICRDEDDAEKRAPLAFDRGDVNGDGHFNISDSLLALNGLFRGDTEALLCADAVDMNDDGAINLSDVVFGLMNQFAAGRDLPDPWREFGHDPTEDDLLCLPR